MFHRLLGDRAWLGSTSQGPHKVQEVIIASATVHDIVRDVPGWIAAESYLDISLESCQQDGRL